jgi:uncharacterized membrane protein
MLDQLIHPKEKDQSHPVKKIESIRDRPIKSIVKSITWRIVGTIDTMIISYILTGSKGTALSIGSIEVFTKMFLYFLHERIWTSVRWGRMLVVIRKFSLFRRKVERRIIS